MRNVSVRWMGAMAAVAMMATPAQAQDKASEVLAAARAAIGGATLEGMKTFSVESRTARNIGDRQMTSEVQILTEAPDKYLRIEDVTAPMPRTLMTGFHGDVAYRPAGMTMRAGGGMMMVMGGPGGAPPAEKMTPEQEAEMNTMLLRSQRAEISRLMLGWFASAHPSLAATYTYAGEAESPDGKADVIDVKAENFDARLFIDQATHLPLMLTYQAPEPRVVTVGGPSRGGNQTFSMGAPHAAGAPPAGGAQPPAAAADAQRQIAAMQAEPPRMVEHRLYFSDWREVDGIRFPFVIQRAVAGNTNEEWEITKVKVNPKIDPRKFQQD